MTRNILRPAFGRPKPPAPQPAAIGDECPCAACNPPPGAAQGRVQYLNRKSEAQP